MFVLLNKIPLKLCWEKKRKYPHVSLRSPQPWVFSWRGSVGFLRWGLVRTTFLRDSKEKVKHEGHSQPQQDLVIALKGLMSFPYILYQFFPVLMALVPKSWLFCSLTPVLICISFFLITQIRQSFLPVSTSMPFTVHW